MLCHQRKIFINGEAHKVDQASYALLRQLADTRELGGTSELPSQALDLLYQWYLDGYIVTLKSK